MATPSVSINVTSVDENEKKIYYTVSFSADYDPEANEENYHKGETGYRYVNKPSSEGFKSYQNEYDNGDSSITFTVTYMWECRAISRKEAANSPVGVKTFSTEAEAQEYINSQEHPEDYIIGKSPLACSVSKRIYDYSVVTTGGYQQSSASATAHFPPKEETVTTNATYSTSYNQNKITVIISNISVGETAQLYIREPDDTTGSLPSYVEKSYKRESSTDSSSVTWTETVEYNVKYIYSVVIQPNNIYIANKIEFILSELFKWKTDIYKGAKIKTYNYMGTSAPAPVTAGEWNDLVKLVNTHYNLSIDKVNSGQHMSAKAPNGNIYLVANALGVDVNSGDIITAQFFLDLQNAINEKIKNG